MIIRKILLIGAIGVGKTSISQRLVFNRWNADYRMTIGSEVLRYELPAAADHPRFQFLVVDTDGNYGKSIFGETIAAGAQAAMVVGDVTRRATLDDMIGLAESFQDKFPARYTAYILNKIDLLEPPARLDLPAKLLKPEFPIFKTSAKTGETVKDAFHEAARTILRRGL